MLMRGSSSRMVPSLKPRLMTAEVGPAGACLALRTPPAAASSSRTSSIFRLGERPEHVVVAGRGVVAADVRVPGTHPATIEDVDPAADTLAVLPAGASGATRGLRSEEHTSELQSLRHLVCRLLLEKKK